MIVPNFIDPGCFYLRNAAAVVVTSRDAVHFVGEEGASLRQHTAQPAGWSAFMQQLANPLPGGAVAELASAIPDLDDELWRRLLADGFLLQATTAERLSVRRDRVFSENNGFHLVAADPACGQLVVACTGSIVAGLMAPTLLSLCYARFQRQLDVVLSPTAERFLTRDLLESYGIRTWVDAFERRDGIPVPHVHLGRSADCILVMPATANALYRLAHATCTDLLSLSVAASRTTVVVAPAMNDAMWNNRAVQRNVRLLREDGMFVVEPTLIFGAADLAKQGQPMYGGHGSLWAGPRVLMQTLTEILRPKEV